MIANKNQLKKALKENKENILIKRIYNFEEDNKVKVGEFATIGKVQSNAYTVNWEVYDKECWVYYDNIEVKDNKIYYYSYVDNRHTREETQEKAKEKGIELIEVLENDKINQNRYSNYKYIYKFVVMINEIIEN